MALRIVAWNCNMALQRKFDALLALAPDLAVVSECAAPGVASRRRDLPSWRPPDVWVGTNPHKGLGIYAFNGYRARLAAGHLPNLRHVAPVLVEGPVAFTLFGVWAQNASGGISRKFQLGPLRRALAAYRHLLAAAPCVLAGDLNNNVRWDRPGWRVNHAGAVAALERHGLVSAYHAVSGEAQGEETRPTLYWRDRREDGPRYHIDYVFVPKRWCDRITHLSVGAFQNWCGSGLSDHVPVVVDIDPQPDN